MTSKGAQHPPLDVLLLPLLPRTARIALASFPFGKPRIILELVGLEVGTPNANGWYDDGSLTEQANTSLVLSICIALLTLTIWVGAAWCCCRSPRRTRGGAAAAPPPRGARQIRACPGLTAEDLWTVHNKRYDLAGFVHAHPGGIHAIGLGRGRNCTALFEERRLYKVP